MAVPKGVRIGGRGKGTPNKVTQDVREAISLIAQRNIEAFESWLADIDDPAKRCDIFLRVMEYHVPKLARTELTGKNGEPIVTFRDLTGRNAAR